jgi:hypothetical protein
MLQNGQAKAELAGETNDTTAKVKQAVRVIQNR